MAVAKCFGVDAIPLAAYVRTSVGLEGEDLPSLFAAAAKKRPAVTGPKSIEDRYMTEDMPYGMVFFRTLGQVRWGSYARDRIVYRSPPGA
jgi:opine dehydrogenase